MESSLRDSAIAESWQSIFESLKIVLISVSLFILLCDSAVLFLFIFSKLIASSVLTDFLAMTVEECVLFATMRIAL